ncbi:MAG: hypothetical protein H6807_15970 [Planctomycetes bacterium]|nr:hypothetical protein [Planctomycetota bacterium]
MTTEKKEVRPGSARARLEAFEREQKGKKSLYVRFAVVLGLLLLVVVIQQLIKTKAPDRSWIELPKSVAYLAREGKWEALAAALDDEIELQGVPAGSKGELLNLIRSHAEEGLGAYATDPHHWDQKGGQVLVDFWIIWSRGDIERAATVPLVQTWLVQALLVRDGGDWKVRKLLVRETLAPGGAPLGDLLDH